MFRVCRQHEGEHRHDEDRQQELFDQLVVEVGKKVPDGSGVIGLTVGLGIQQPLFQRPRRLFGIVHFDLRLNFSGYGALMS